MQVLFGHITTSSYEADEDGMLLTLLSSLFEGIIDQCDLCEDTLNFEPIFDPLFVVFLVTTKNKNGVHLGHIVHTRQNMLLK